MIPFSTTTDDLARLGVTRLPAGVDEAPTFPLKIPPAYAARIGPDPDDPLLRQVLPDLRERRVAADESVDPVGDLAAQRAPRLLQKYSGRALLITTGACPVHCRYCFRRHYPYPDSTVTRDDLASAFDTLTEDPGIREIVLSGGDPLSLADGRLAALIDDLASIEHLQTLRIHTRFPVVIPQRVSDSLIDTLAHWPRILVIVIHCNHGREIDRSAGDALQRLRKLDAVLLNQSVLLRGVNDDGDILAELSVRLFEKGVLPYYLHMLDPVEGTAHFRVSTARARHLVDALRARLPGYLVPRLVREIAGAESKIAV